MNKRQITKFLWFPKTIEGKTKWLVKATWEEEYWGYAWQVENNLSLRQRLNLRNKEYTW